MLQVKDPQEVYDQLAKPLIASLTEGMTEDAANAFNEIAYQSYVLGEMFGTVSTCLAKNIPIPKEVWDMPVVRSFVRGDVDDVVVVDDEPEMSLKTAQEIYTQCSPSVIPMLIEKGFNPTIWT